MCVVDTRPSHTSNAQDGTRHVAWMDVLMMCLHIRFAGTLREPFFKRRRDGSFYFESGGLAALALAGLFGWGTGAWKAARCTELAQPEPSGPPWSRPVTIEQ